MQQIHNINALLLADVLAKVIRKRVVLQYSPLLSVENIDERHGHLKRLMLEGYSGRVTD